MSHDLSGEYPYQAGPSNPMSALRIMPSTKQQIEFFSNAIVNSVQNGEANAIEVLVILRALEAVSKKVLSEIKGNIDTASDKYSEKSFEVFGARIEKADTHTEYDYATSGDKEWEQFSVYEKTAAANRKDREKFLRALKGPISCYDEESGETWTIKPPLKRSTSGLKVFLK